jgi:hypothetical protein
LKTYKAYQFISNFSGKCDGQVSEFSSKVSKKAARYTFFVVGSGAVGSEEVA